MKTDFESERWRHLNEVYNRISEENPDENDPGDARGCSTAWPPIQEELDAVAFAMLNRPPQSFTDLAWQTEALLLAEVELREGSHADHPMLPKLFENIRILAGPLAIPSIVPAAKPDPIFGAIEAHRTALAHHSAAVRIECDLDETLPSDKRRSTLTVWEEKIVETDDPRWPAALRARVDASNAADDVAVALFDIEPTTVPGAIALLKYVEGQEDEVFPDNLVDDDGKGISFGRAIAGHVGDALSEMRQSA